jgi:hypothetical protein
MVIAHASHKIVGYEVVGAGAGDPAPIFQPDIGKRGKRRRSLSSGRAASLTVSSSSLDGAIRRLSYLIPTSPKPRSIMWCAMGQWQGFWGWPLEQQRWQRRSCGNQAVTNCTVGGSETHLQGASRLDTREDMYSATSLWTLR